MIKPYPEVTFTAFLLDLGDQNREILRPPQGEKVSKNRPKTKKLIRVAAEWRGPIERPNREVRWRGPIERPRWRYPMGVHGAAEWRGPMERPNGEAQWRGPIEMPDREARSRGPGGGIR